MFKGPENRSNLMQVIGHIVYLLKKTRFESEIMKFPKKLFSEEEKDTMIDEVKSFIETNNK